MMLIAQSHSALPKGHLISVQLDAGCDGVRRRTVEEAFHIHGHDVVPTPFGEILARTRPNDAGIIY